MMITLEVKHCHWGRPHPEHVWMNTIHHGSTQFYCDGKPTIVEDETARRDALADKLVEVRRKLQKYQERVWAFRSALIPALGVEGTSTDDELIEEFKKLKERLVSWEDEAGRLRRIADDHGKTVDYYRETLTDILGFDERPSDAELLRAVQNRFKRIEMYEDRPSKGDFIALRKDWESEKAKREVAEAELDNERRTRKNVDQQLAREKGRRENLEKVVAERNDLAYARLRTIRAQDKKLRQIRAITEEEID